MPVGPLRFESPSMLPLGQPRPSTLPVPLSDLGSDRSGETARLWLDPKSGLVATLHPPHGPTKTFKGDAVRSALGAERGDSLLAQLMRGERREWAIVAAGDGTVRVWPKLRAAGSTDYYAFARERFSPFKDTKTLERAEQVLASKGFELQHLQGAGLGSSWYHAATGRFAIVNPANDAVPASVTMTFRGHGQPVDPQSERPARPGGYRAGVRETVFERAREYNGRVYDTATTQELGRKNWQMGHNPGFESRKSRDLAAQDQHTRQTLCDVHNISWHYRPESAAANQGHGFEKPDGQYFGAGPLPVVEGRQMTAIIYPLDSSHPKWELVLAYRDYMYGQNSAKTFAEFLQMAGLVETYNSFNPEHPVATLGAGSNPLGGVGLQFGQFDGLKDAVDVLVQPEHTFVIASTDGEAPFTNAQLQQVLRELAIGIFVHGKRPMFSLHFNAEGQLYSVIPPEYANTLVGRVMGMLDYMIKGYLHGGIYDEAFLSNWLERGMPNTQDNFQGLIDLRETFRKLPGKSTAYHSLREVLLAFGLADDPAGRAITSSFRIIADNPLEHTDGHFIIGHNFRVEYTIEGSAELNEMRRQHRAQHGTEPEAYAQLDGAYKAMAESIRVNMPKLPMCREYFHLLGVIHFFTQYFATLKEAQRAPLLDPIQTPRVTQFPALLPPLPLRQAQKQEINVALSAVAARMPEEALRRLDGELSAYARGNTETFLASPQSIDAVYTALADYMQGELAADVREDTLPNVPKILTDVAAELRRQVPEDDETRRNINECLRTVAERAERLVRERQELRGTEADLRRLAARMPLGPRRDALIGDSENASRQDHASLQAAQKELDDQRELLLQALEELDVVRYRPLRVSNMGCSFEVLTSNFKLPERRPAAGVLEQINYRIVGGCGLQLGLREPLAFNEGETFIQSASRALCDADFESLVQIGGTTGGHFAFKLPLSVCPTTDNADYAWLRALLIDSPETAWTERAWQIAAAIVAPQPSFEEVSSALGGGRDDIHLLNRADEHGATLLHYAASVGDVCILDLLLKSGADVNVIDQQGLTPLHVAARSGHTDGVRCLLDCGASRDVQSTSTRATPLHLAVLEGHTEVVLALIRAGASPSFAMSNGMQPLHSAIVRDDAALFNVLRQGGANLEAKLPGDGTAVHLAAQLGRTALLRRLIDPAGSAPILAERRDSLRPLHLAASAGHSDACRVIIEKLRNTGTLAVGLDQKTAVERTALHLAATAGHTETVECLLAAGASAEVVDGQGEDALIAALRAGSAAAAVPLARRCSVTLTNKQGETAAGIAMRYGFWAVVDVLASRGADLRCGHGKNRWTVAHYLCRRNNFVRLAAWFDQGRLGLAQLRARDAQGHPPAAIALAYGADAVLALFRARNWPTFEILNDVRGAAVAGSLEVLRPYLRAPGSDLEHLGEGLKGNKSLAYLAAENGHLQTLRALLRGGAKVHYQVAETPYVLLRAAIEGGNHACVELVLKHDGDLRAPLGPDGLGAAQLASRLGHLSLLRLLKSRGARLDDVDEAGHGALHEAIIGGFEKVLDYLLEPEYGIIPDALALQLAVRRNSLPMLKKLLDMGLAVPTELLFYAIDLGRIDLLRHLLAAGGAMNAERGGQSLLGAASAAGDLGLVQALFEAGADAHLDGQVGGRTALHWACERGHAHVVAYLQEAGADTTRLTDLGQSCTELAANRPDVLTVLAGTPAIYKKQHQALIRALEEEDIGALKVALEHLPLTGSITLDGGRTFRPISHLLAESPLSAAHDLLDEDALAAHGSDGFTGVMAAVKGKQRTLVAKALREGIALDARTRQGHGLLHLAAALKDTRLVAMLLASGRFDLDETDEAGNTPLLLAVSAQAVATVDALIDAGAAPDKAALNRNTPLAVACSLGLLPLVCRLLDAGADVHAPAGADRVSCLQIAIKGSHLEVVLELLARGAHLHHANALGQFAIHQAALHAEPRVMQALLAAEPGEARRRSSDGWEPIHMAALNRQHVQVIEALREAGAELDAPSVSSSIDDGVVPLIVAAHAGNTAAFDALYKAGANIPVSGPIEQGVVSCAARTGSLMHYHGRYPQIFRDGDTLHAALLGAAQAGDVEAIRHLVTLGVSVDATSPSSSTPVLAATRANKPTALAALLALGADPKRCPEGQDPAIFVAVSHGNLAAVTLLFANGVPQDGRDSEGKTLLHRAVESQQPAMVLLLILRGLNLESRDHALRTALDRAIQLGSEAMAHLLVIMGAALPDPPTPETESLRGLIGAVGEKRLHRAARAGHATVIDALTQIDRLDAVDGSGKTALHLVSGSRCTRLLLERGADPNVVDARGETPLWRALRAGLDANVALLLSHGARLEVSVDGVHPLLYAYREHRRGAFARLLTAISAKDVDQEHEALESALKEGNLEAAVTTLSQNGLPGDAEKRFAPLLEGDTDSAEFLVRWLGLTKPANEVA